MVVSFSVIFPPCMSEVFFSRIMYEQSFFSRIIALFQYSIIMRVTLSPQHIFRKKIDFVGLVSCRCSHACVYVFDRYVPCVLHFVNRVADPKSWYALDSPNSTTAGLKRLLAVTTHFDARTNLDP